jgi:hypothetical protein
MIIPKECSNDMSYGAIIRQVSVHALNIDTSIPHNTFSWHNTDISMVLRDYWTAEQIQQQKKKLTSSLQNMQFKLPTLTWVGGQKFGEIHLPAGMALSEATAVLFSQLHTVGPVLFLQSRK